MLDNNFEFNINNIMETFQKITKERQELEIKKKELEASNIKLEKKIEVLQEEKTNIILERDQTLEINEVLYNSLNEKVNDLIRENGKLVNETVSTKDYLSLMKLNGYLIFDLKEALIEKESL